MSITAQGPGRIASDIELKVTKTGTKIVNFSFVSDREYQKKGEPSKSDFVNIVCFGPKAEFMNSYCFKGQQIYVRGELQTEEYTNKQGQKVKGYKIVADQIHPLEWKKKEEKQVSMADDKTMILVDCNDLPF